MNVSASFGTMDVSNDESMQDSFAKNEGLKIEISDQTMNNTQFPENLDIKITKSGSFLPKGVGLDKINKTWKNNQWILSDLEKTNILGSGSSGVVYKAIHKKTHEVVALKSISVFENTKRKQISNELKTLIHIPSDSKYVVGFFGAFYDEGIIHFALEYMEGGSLKDIYQLSTNRIPESVLAIISYQVLNGLRFLHQKNRTVHRDIKPSNILMNKNGDFKITDFGVSTKKQKTLSNCNTFIGTISYMSPERLYGKPYSYSSDIWSFGITLLEIAIKHFPFKSKDGKPMSNFWEFLNFIKSNPPPKLKPSDGFSSEICDFIDLCLKVNPDYRSSVFNLLKHKFIQKHIGNKGSIIYYKKWADDVLTKVRNIHENARSFNSVQNLFESKLENNLII